MNETHATEGDGIVAYACVEGIATITFKRPHNLNAFDDEMAVALAEALRRFDVDPDAHVAVLCGQGPSAPEQTCKSVSFGARKSCAAMVDRRPGVRMPMSYWPEV